MRGGARGVELALVGSAADAGQKPACGVAAIALTLCQPPRKLPGMLGVGHRADVINGLVAQPSGPILTQRQCLGRRGIDRRRDGYSVVDRTQAAADVVNKRGDLRLPKFLK